ncbi:Cytochrome P450 [Neofusicoccum parvum]|uniref:Cytochrome P450 n=1 Tax=Neofusicoccum parvum TaxID=310453 RepID=A0ACB5SHD0_9PEZI|nr:Cytochrome P450 [Neofusicoccum parvum]
MDTSDLPAHPSLVLAAGLLLAYLFYGAVYRLYLSPIAHFPGPRLAALTFWYEFYYDVVCAGKYTWRIVEMHEKYGPVVRINPFELHVNVPEFYDELYVSAASGRRTEKWEWSAKMFGTTQAAVGTASHELHRLRRQALNPFFSRRSVAQLEPVIQANVDKLRARLEGFADTGVPVNVTDAFTALSADVIGSFAFGRSYGFLDAEDFNPGWHKLMVDLSRGTHLMKQFGWLYTILTCIPQKVVSIIHPLTKELFDVQNSITAQIEAIKSNRIPTTTDPKPLSPTSDPPTILHSLLTTSPPPLPPSELSTPRLTEEAFTLLGAGTVTTASTLATTLYHLLASPPRLSRLRAEIAGAGHPLTWTALERLPYLSAALSEGLRLSYGVSHRLARVSPDAALRVPGVAAAVPPGTPTSMTQMLLHDDPALFPEPRAFRPERWLGAAAEVAARRRWLVPFSRGTRQCVGLNLAYAEMYLVLGALLGPGLGLELWETGRADVSVVHDFFNPAPGMESKGVRVMARREDGVGERSA